MRHSLQKGDPMIFFIISALVAVAVFSIFVVTYWEYDKEMVGVGALFALVLLEALCLCSVWFTEMTMGMMPDYSTGQREGYIIKVSEKGFLWKTIECEMQLGAGEQASLQEPFHFSIAKGDGANLDQVNLNIGKRVSVEYTQWLIMPFRLGESGYLAKSIHQKETP